MPNRCRICGIPVNYVSICNHCRTVREERRFLKMVAREELRETRRIDRVKPPRTVKKNAS